MRPLIPRIRLGDVLYGTRHLRHYLRAVSVLNQLSTLSEYNRDSIKRIGAGKLLPPLYIPRKEDQFITAVNTDGRFAVWSPNGSVVLLFINPTVPPHEVARHLKGPSPIPAGGFLALPTKKRIGVPRMNATIFSKWFVRTPLRNLDAGAWPPYAAGLRLCFHHNLIAWGHKDTDGVCLHYSTVTAWNSPFVNGMSNKNWNPKDLDEQESHLQHSAVRGVLRPQAFKDKLVSGMRLEGTGPTLELLPGIRKEIARAYEMCVEKGTIRRTKNRVGTDGSHPETDVLGVLGDLGPDLLGSNALDVVSE